MSPSAVDEKQDLKKRIIKELETVLEDTSSDPDTKVLNTILQDTLWSTLKEIQQSEIQETTEVGSTSASAPIISNTFKVDQYLEDMQNIDRINLILNDIGKYGTNQEKLSFLANKYCTGEYGELCDQKVLKEKEITINQILSSPQYIWAFILCLKNVANIKTTLVSQYKGTTNIEIVKYISFSTAMNKWNIFGHPDTVVPSPAPAPAPAPATTPPASTPATTPPAPAATPSAPAPATTSPASPETSKISKDLANLQKHAPFSSEAVVEKVSKNVYEELIKISKETHMPNVITKSEITGLFRDPQTLYTTLTMTLTTTVTVKKNRSNYYQYNEEHKPILEFRLSYENNTLLIEIKDKTTTWQPIPHMYKESKQYLENDDRSKTRVLSLIWEMLENTSPLDKFTGDLISFDWIYQRDVTLPSNATWICDQCMTLVTKQNMHQDHSTFLSTWVCNECYGKLETLEKNVSFVFSNTRKTQTILDKLRNNLEGIVMKPIPNMLIQTKSATPFVTTGIVFSGVAILRFWKHFNAFFKTACEQNPIECKNIFGQLTVAALKACSNLKEFLANWQEDLAPLGQTVFRFFSQEFLRRLYKDPQVWTLLANIIFTVILSRGAKIMLDKMWNYTGIQMPSSFQGLFHTLLVGFCQLYLVPILLDEFLIMRTEDSIHVLEINETAFHNMNATITGAVSNLVQHWNQTEVKPGWIWDTNVPSEMAKSVAPNFINIVNSTQGFRNEDARVINASVIWHLNTINPQQFINETIAANGQNVLSLLNGYHDELQSAIAMSKVYDFFSRLSGFVTLPFAFVVKVVGIQTQNSARSSLLEGLYGALNDPYVQFLSAIAIASYAIHYLPRLVGRKPAKLSAKPPSFTQRMFGEYTNIWKDAVERDQITVSERNFANVKGKIDEINETYATQYSKTFGWIKFVASKVSASSEHQMFNINKYQMEDPAKPRKFSQLFLLMMNIARPDVSEKIVVPNVRHPSSKPKGILSTSNAKGHIVFVF